jgi:hypothetical protein
MDQTKSIYLPSSSKLVYMQHHKFLPPKHRYHQWRSCFDSTIENGEALKHRDGKIVFEMIKNINVVFGNPMKGIKRMKREKPPKDTPFKKKLIFFRYLPYWKSDLCARSFIYELYVSVREPYGSYEGLCTQSCSS